MRWFFVARFEHPLWHTAVYGWYQKKFRRRMRGKNKGRISR